MMNVAIHNFPIGNFSNRESLFKYTNISSNNATAHENIEYFHLDTTTKKKTQIEQILRMTVRKCILLYQNCYSIIDPAYCEMG